MAVSFNAVDTTAIVSITGFAIQQVLQIVDPVVLVLVQSLKRDRSTNDLPGGLSEADFKKSMMAILPFAFGMLAVQLTGIRLLALFGKYDDFGQLDSGGLYTAPPTPGTYQIKIVSMADSTKYVIATVTVT